MTAADERTLRVFQCDHCNTVMAIWPHWEATEDVPPPEDWEGNPFLECPVCDSRSWPVEEQTPVPPVIRTGYAQGGEQ